MQTQQQQQEQKPQKQQTTTEGLLFDTKQSDKWTTVAMASFCDAGEIKNIINEDLSKLYIKDENNKYRPPVCINCFTGPNWASFRPKTLEEMKHELRSDEINDNIRRHYIYKGELSQPWMEECLLSPRGICSSKGSGKVFVACKDCAGLVRKKRFPKRSIANGFVFVVHHFN